QWVLVDRECSSAPPARTRVAPQHSSGRRSPGSSPFPHHRSLCTAGGRGNDTTDSVPHTPHCWSIDPLRLRTSDCTIFRPLPYRTGSACTPLSLTRHSTSFPPSASST